MLHSIWKPESLRHCFYMQHLEYLFSLLMKLKFNELKIFPWFLMQRYCNWQTGYSKILNHLVNNQVFALKVAITLLYSSNYCYILLYINSLHAYMKLLLKTKPQACLMQHLMQHLLIINGYSFLACRGSPHNLSSCTLSSNSSIIRELKISEAKSQYEHHFTHIFNA